MVAYDSGAVVIDHICQGFDLAQSGRSVFADNAAHHAELIRSLGIGEARVGQVDGEYCPGEFSVNIAGKAKVVGSAQRVTGGRSLFSTVVQAAMTEQVRAALISVSAALGYPLAQDTIAGLNDFGSTLTAQEVALAFAADYRTRYQLAPGSLPTEFQSHAMLAQRDSRQPRPFHVGNWIRANALAD
jgi:hypothetical protein